LAAIAGGEVAVAAVLVVGSSVVTVLAGGAILAALSGAPSMHPGGLAITLVLVVGLPLALGVVLRQVLAAHAAVLEAGRLLGVGVVLVLLWEVVGEVELRASYLGVVAALVGFVAGAGALGWLVT
jgi:ACR3 family arsenite efflux pump ArsB